MSGGTAPDTGRSPMTMRPSVTGTSPAISPSSVVLPQPEGPTRLTNRPASTRKLTSRTAVKSPVGVSNVRVTRSSVIIALMGGDDSIRSAGGNLDGSRNQGQGGDRHRGQPRDRTRDGAHAPRGWRARGDLRADSGDARADAGGASGEDRR